MSRSVLRTSIVFLLVAALSACAAPPTAAPTEEVPPTEAPQEEATAVPPTEEASPTEEVTTIWSDPVIFGTHGEPNSIDPATVSNSTSEGLVITAVYEGLTRYTQDGEIIPWLATDWEISDDATVYTFQLREGVKFHDGTDFDAEAVKTSFERTKDMQLGTVAFVLEAVDEIEVIDDLQVRITLSTPDINFWFGVPLIRVVSPAALEANAGEDGWAQDFFRENGVGTGPYRVERWDRGTQLILTAFEDYWRGWAGKHLKQFVIRYGLDYSTRILLLEEGEIHLVDYAGLSDIRRVETNPDITGYANSPVWGFYQFIKQSGPLADVNVRRALLHAFPYEDMIEVMQGSAELMESPLSPKMIGYCEVFEPKQDLEKAKELLTEADYEEGEIKLTQAYRFANEPRRLAAQLFQEAAGEIGIEIELEDVEWGVFVQAQKEKDTAYDTSSLWVSTPIPYGGAQLRLLAHSSMQGVGRNWAFYENPGFDALLEEARTLSPEDPRLNELLCEAQQILIDDVVVIPIMVSQNWDLARTELKNYEADWYNYPVDLHLYEAWLEE